jgi:hypothetical protein
MKPYVVRDDVEQWLPLIDWLEKPAVKRDPTGTVAVLSAIA